MESGGLAGRLVDVDVRIVQQLVGDDLVVEDDGDPQRSVLNAVTWNTRMRPATSRLSSHSPDSETKLTSA